MQNSLLIALFLSALEIPLVNSNWNDYITKFIFYFTHREGCMKHWNVEQCLTFTSWLNPLLFLILIRMCLNYLNQGFFEKFYVLQKYLKISFWFFLTLIQSLLLNTNSSNIQIFSSKYNFVNYTWEIINQHQMAVKIEYLWKI